MAVQAWCRAHERLVSYLPSAATERLVKAGDLTMKIVEAGSGPAVLLLHGLGWDHSLWNPTVEQFSPRYRMIAADTRGHGGTDKPAGPYDMAMFARDYAALADALGLKRVCVVGLSQGGMVAQKLALLRPDLVSALVLISTSCKSAPSLRDNMEARIAAMDKAGPEAAAKIAAESIFSPGWRAANAAELARFYAWRSAMPSEPLNAGDPGALRLRSVERLAVHRRTDAGRRRRRGRADTPGGHGGDCRPHPGREIPAHSQIRPHASGRTAGGCFSAVA